MSGDWIRKHAFQLCVAGFIGLCFLYGLGRAGWYRFVTAKSVQPAQTDICAMGSLDVAGFRNLVSRIERDGESGGGGCGEASSPASCLQGLLKARVDSYMRVAGPDMIGRMMAMHAVMRANKAVLISQATVPPRQPPSWQISESYRKAFPDRVEKPLVRRAETFTYALDQRAVGMAGPALFGGGSGRGGGLSYDTGRTSFPTGLYGIAEVVITLSDPALRYPDDADTGAVAEAIDYTEAAWSSRKPYDGLVPRYRAPLPADTVYEIASLCPRRPAWLDTPAVPSRLPGAPSQADRQRELFQWADRMRNQPGRPATSP
ncbi:hypothetical protein LJR009_005267 [Bosea sp. LjRoot9]|uniref:hypothetical protein n=1 Tax=Bosea sp. LjRoot9 TaxID=3342341 RepID=UPI003ECF1F45